MYEAPKIFFFFVGAIVFILFLITEILINHVVIKFDLQDRIFLIWLLILLIASFLGVHPLDSIIGGSYRHQGVIFFVGLWLLYKSLQQFTKEQRKYFGKGIAIAVILESLIVIAQYLFNQTYFGRTLGTLGEANAVSGFLVIGIFLVYENFPRVWLFLTLTAILVTQSRSGILSLAPNLLRLKKIFWLPLFVISIVIISFLTFDKGKSYFENRPMLWRQAYLQIIKKPILGYGAESGEYVYEKAFRENNTPLEHFVIDRAHNLFLDILIWSGIPGLIMFVWWLYTTFINLDSLNKKLAFSSFLIFSMFQPLGVTHWVLLMFVVGS